MYKSDKSIKWRFGLTTSEIETARKYALTALSSAKQLINNPASFRRVNLALVRYFYGSTNLQTLSSRISTAHTKLRSARIITVLASNDAPRDDLQRLATAAARRNMPAFVDERGQQIVLLPNWFSDTSDLRPGRLIHEVFHLSFRDVRGHDRNNPFTNAFAYQGFVCALANLPAPVPDQMYPANLSM